MTAPAEPVVVLLFADSEDRGSLLRGLLSMILPGASIRSLTSANLAEGALEAGDAALIDVHCGACVGSDDSETVGGGPVTVVMKNALQPAMVLRARGFTRPIVVVANVPDEKAFCAAAETLGVVAVARERCEESPAPLARALSSAFEADARVTPTLVRARRVFAAGQTALSLQHAINNPLAALMAEAQLLQMEELNGEQRGSVDRMVELCRRISALVRQLDAIGDG
ncbi:MAG TPA: histidine kinase dimerization/phospho-acceptor domain-containing protein [Gemmatimonadaceae bacterium]|nr:histidine kinase dimerization/phospho-acceptor domain-containing protein [Gemmatimonadaceae bacterium]